MKLAASLVAGLFLVTAITSCTSSSTSDVATTSPAPACCGGTPTGGGSVAANPDPCPKHPSFTPWPGSDKVMVPGQPVVAVVCGRTPASRAVLTDAQLDKLVHVLNDLPAGPPPHICSAQDILRRVYYFSYGASTQLQVVEVSVGGCPFVSNGAMEWHAARNDDLQAVLKVA
jgi:hypothetical protein